MRIFKNIQHRSINYAHTQQWYNLRQITIPSSLIRKAVSGSGKFLQYYETIDVYSAGVAIESVVLDLFKNQIEKGKQIFAKITPYISAPPDGFLIRDNTPVEIKTKLHGSLDNVIRLHYHQIQFTMYCAGSNKLILIVYIINQNFDIVEVKRDEAFIQHYLPRVNYACFPFLFKYGNTFSRNDMKVLNKQNKLYDENL